MGNHWHLVLWPRRDGDLPAFMRWTTLTHVQRFHASHGTVGIGHLYQVRLQKLSCSGQRVLPDGHAVCRGQPCSAGIVEQAGDWRWSSFAVRQGRASKVGLRVCSGLTTLKMIS